MNRKQLVILLVLVVILGGVGFLLARKQQSSWSAASGAAGKKILPDLPVNDVAHLALKQGAQEVNVVKSNDLWRVRERGGYPANFSQITEFLLKLRELKAVQTLEAGPSQWPRLQLSPAEQGSNAALVVEFKGANDRALGTLLLGKKHLNKSGQRSPFGGGEDEGWPDGRYVKVGADSHDVAVVSDALENIEARPEAWLSKDFFHVEKARSVAVMFPVTTNSWKLTRETEAGDWKLANARPDEGVDPAKVGGAAAPLSGPSFSEVLSGDRVPGEGTNAPTILAIDTFDHFHYTVRVGAKTNEDYWLTVAVNAELPKERAAGKDEKPEDKAKLDKEFKDRQQKLEEKLKQEQSYGKWTYLVSGWALEPLLKERSQFLAEKKEEGTDASTNAVHRMVEPKLENPPLPAIAPK